MALFAGDIYLEWKESNRRIKAKKLEITLNFKQKDTDFMWLFLATATILINRRLGEI